MRPINSAADHSSAPPPHDDDASPWADRQSRLGLILFAIYTTVYGGFVVVAAFLPGTMGRPVWGGVNLAVLYGLGLIVGAILLAIVYMIACSRLARRDANNRV